MASAIYSSPLLCRWAMKMRFRDYYTSRLQKVAAEIPYGSKVIDLCCGDCAIYRRFLRYREKELVDLWRTLGVSKIESAGSKIMGVWER